MTNLRNIKKKKAGGDADGTGENKEEGDKGQDNKKDVPVEELIQL